jgi:DNA-binding HxlR family transcriptional regulator
MQVTRYRATTEHASAAPMDAYHEDMAPSRRISVGGSPLGAALERIGDRWSPRIVEVLLAGPLRYGELQASVAGIAPNILADRLRRLEADGLLAATAYAERPPRFEYRLTAEGRALAGALRLLADWGAQHGGGASADHEAIRHAACGTALEARWFCPTCGEVVDADAGTDVMSEGRDL